MHWSPSAAWKANADTIENSAGPESIQVWQRADLGARHTSLRAGFGWGYLRLHMVKDDIERGTLAKVRMQVHSTPGPGLSVHAIYMKDEPPGPAGRWFVDRLKQS